jgi:DNA repair protein SbcD/Mre11
LSGISGSNRLRILHTADLHLERSFSSWESAAQVRPQDLYDVLDQIGEIARREQVHLVLLAGDQFDRHNPSGKAFARFRGWLERLHADGIQAAMIPGNHDSYWYGDSVYRQGLPDRTLLFTEPDCAKPVELSINGISVHLYGIAHDHTRERDVLPGFRRRHDDGVHIGMLHATVDPPADFNVLDRYLPLRSEQLRETGLDYIALGHIHRARTINPGVPGMASYPGSPEPLTTTETGSRSVNLLTFGGGAPTLETITCGRRRAERRSIDCTGLNADEIARHIATLADENLILGVNLTGAPDDLIDPDMLRARTAGYFCYLTITDETAVVDTGFVRRIEGERTIRGEFVRRLRERIEQAENERERERAALALRLGLIQLERRSAQ